MEACALEGRRCVPCEGGVAPLDDAACGQLLTQLPGWAREGQAIVKTLTFANHYEAVAFVNAVAWVSHREDHHPEVTFGYRDVTVRYWTHAVGGLSENDFICATKVDKLLA